MLQVKVCEYYCWNSMHMENAKYWFAIKIVLEPERNNIEDIPVNLSYLNPRQPLVTLNLLTSLFPLFHSLLFLCLLNYSLWFQS